jgi:KDO2-lipid IV(A) lauroyltransferase
VIEANLNLAFEEVSPAFKKEITKSCYINMAMTLLQIMENPQMTHEKLQSMVTFKNKEAIDQAIREGKKIILVSSHYGNWELLGLAISALVVPTTSVSKKLNNPHFDQHLTTAREALNLNMVEKKGAVKFLMNALRDNRAISLLIDQNTHENDGILVDFFGHPARQSPSTSFLARKFDAIIFPAFITTDDYEHYTITFEDPIIVDKTDNKEEDIQKASQKQSDIMENIIRKNPKPWFWCHRRWRNTHEHLYEK